MNQGIDFEIIWKKMHKEASEQEEILLDQWLNEHPSHRKFYDCALDYYTNGTRFANSPAELKKALHSIYRKSGIRTSLLGKKIISITSLTVGTVLLIFMHFNKTETSQTILIEQSVQSIVCKTSKAILVLDVGLTGERYFKVPGNWSKPFLSSQDNQKIKVLGNQFNIYSYDENIEKFTTLVEGRVDSLQSNPPFERPMYYMGKRRIKTRT